MSEFWKNKYTAECMGCQSACDPPNGIILSRCKHLFCKMCFLEKITETDKKVYCPYKNQGYFCKNQIQDHLLQIMSNDELANFKTKRSGGKTNGHFYRCKSPNCTGWCYYTDDTTVFNCPECKKANCLICLVIHGASNCEEYWETMIYEAPAPGEIEPFANDRNLTANKEIVTCYLCNKLFQPNTAIIIHQCRHTFCNDCLKIYIRQSISFDVKCPYKFKNYTCAAFLDNQEILLLTDWRTYRNLLTKTMPIMQNEFIYICTTLNCAGWSICDDDVDKFPCPLCGKTNCLHCKVIHEGQTCEQYLIALRKERYPHLNENSYEMFGLIQDLVSNTEEFTCNICYCDIEPGDGAIFKCIHEFCKECLKMHIEISDEPEIRCPEEKCIAIIRDCEIRELVSEEQYEKYVKRSMQSALIASRDIFTCRTNDCYGHVVYDLNSGDKEFPCYVCKCINCLLCEAIHMGKTCAAYKEDFGKPLEIVMANEMLRDGKAMRCPNCKNVIEKVEGCDWIKCVCKTELCWATKGSRWGPNGPNDTTGGCKCRLNGGPPCTPTCGNCH